MKKLSIITPVYFNSESLIEHSRQINEVRLTLEKEYNMSVEIIYVNDGSGDDSFEKLKNIKEKYGDWVKVISLSKNFGVMPAISSALDFVTGDCLSILSADLQDSPESLLKLVGAWKQGCKFAICVRSKRSDPFLSTLYSKLYYYILRKFVIKSYPNGGYDTHIIDKSLFPLYKRRAKNFNLQLYTFWLGIKPQIFYEDRKQREHGKSRWTFRKKLKLMVDSFIGFSTAPLRIISTLALSVSFFSFLYCIVIFANALLGHVKVPGYATIVCLLSFLLGLVILMLTIIAEYIVRIYDEVTDKPEYVIEEVL